VKISWYSNPTFGPINSLKLVWKGDTISRNYFPSTVGTDPYRGSTTMEIRPLGSGYFRLEAEFNSGRVAYTNPVFISEPNPVGRATISGVVLNRATGTPISGATVRTYVGQSAATDVNGNYRLELPVTTRGSYHTLVASAPQYLAEKARWLFKNGTPYKLDFSVGAPGQTSGQSSSFGGGASSAAAMSALPTSESTVTLTIVNSANALAPYAPSDNPDDNYSSADSNARLIGTGAVDLNLSRVALKKGKTKVLIAKNLGESRKALDSLDENTSIEERAKIEGEFAHAWAGYDKFEPEITRQIDEAPDVAILARGFYAEAQNLLSELGEPATLIEPDFSPQIVKDHPILFIPSYSLTGLDGSDNFKAGLAEYAKAGGTIIAFDQQWGREYKALPGGQIDGLGWREGRSCRWADTEIDTFNPALSGMANTIADTNQDGYFTAWPDDSTVMLRGTTRAGGQPVMLVYPFGEGKVVVSSIFPDWSYGMYSATRDDKIIVRDLVAWSKDSTDVPDYNPGERLTVTQKVKNVMRSDATQIKLTVVDPDRNEVTSTILPVAIASMDETEAGLTIVAPDKLGIYFVDYTLLDEDRHVVQPHTEGARFAISKFKASPNGYSTGGANLAFSIATTDERIPVGSDPVFTVSITNDGNRDETVIAKYENEERQINIAAGSSENFVYTKPNMQRSGSFNVTFYDVEGKQLGAASKGYWLFTPSIDLTIKSDRNRYTKDGVVSGSVSLTSETDHWPVALRISALDPQGDNVFSQSFDFTLSDAIITQQFDFTLSHKPRLGGYILKAETFYKGQKVGFSATTFKVSGPQLSVSPVLPAGSPDSMTFKVANSDLVSARDVSLSAQLYGPTGALVARDAVAFDLAAGAETRLNLFSLPSLEQGSYQLKYQLDTEGGIIADQTTLPNKARALIDFDKSSYRTRDDLNLNMKVSNAGSLFVQDLGVRAWSPDADFSATETLTLAPGEARSFNYRFFLPETLSPGKKKINVALTSGDKRVETFDYLIPSARLKQSFEKTNFTSEETITVDLENIGGVDAGFSQTVTLTDMTERIVNALGTTETIYAGGRRDFAFHLPAGLVSGNYLLKSVVKSLSTGAESILSKTIRVAGVSATLSASTDEAAYLKGDSILARAGITNVESALTGGVLTLQAGAPGEAKSEIGFARKWGSRGGVINTEPLDVAVDRDGNTFAVVYGHDYTNSYVQKYDSAGKLVARWGGGSQFVYPAGIAVDAQGNVYVADSWANSVQKFDSNGNFITKWGNTGMGDGQLMYPNAIAVDAQGNVYVAEYHRVQKFSPNGEFLFKWGSYGSNNGQFNWPCGIAIDSSGRIYVADSENSRIQKFDSNGNFLSKWGSYGSDDGQFESPMAVDIDSTGNVYVADSDNQRIQKFDSNGNFLDKLGSFGQADGQFNYPVGAALDSSGNLYVADRWNYRIQKFNSINDFSGKWTTKNLNEGKFGYPEDVAVDKQGDVYVADTENSRIQKFDSSGQLLTLWGEPGSGDGQFSAEGLRGVATGSDNVYVLDTLKHRVQRFDSEGNFILKWGSPGGGDGELWYPSGITVDLAGNVYVADTGNHRIQKFDSNGDFITKWGTEGAGDLQFEWPWGVAADAHGNVYIADTGNNRIQKFDAQGNFITKWGSYGTGEGQLDSPWHMAIDAADNLYVVDNENNRIQKFDASGNFMAQWGNYGRSDGQFRWPEGVAVDTHGNVYVADTYNNRIQKFTQGSSGGVLWQKDLPISLASQETTEITEAIGQLNATGKLWLNATLKSALDQTIAEDKYPFYVYPGNTAVTLETDKKVYKPGETVNVTGVITNNAQLPLLDRQLTVFAGNNAVLSENVLALAPGESRFFSASFVGDQPVPIKGVFDDVTLEDQIDVVESQVEMTVDAPDVVGRGDFDFNIDLKNTGSVDATTMLEIKKDGQTVSTETVSITAGATTLVQKTCNLTGDALFEVFLNGDAQAAFPKSISFGERVSINVTPDSVYADSQEVVVPYEVNNTGSLDSSFDITFVMGDQTIVRQVFVPAGETLADELHIGSLDAGNYELAWSTLFETDSKTFKVLKETDIGLDVAPVDSSGGKIKVSGTIKNSGLRDFTGVLKVDSDFNEDERALDIASGDTTDFDFNINAAGAAPGAHDVTVKVLDGGGNVIKEVNRQAEVKAAVFEIIDSPERPNLTLGQSASLTFKIKNTGNLEGEARLNLNLPDVYEGEKSAWIKSGETTDIVFGFTVPEDIEDKDYKGAFSLEGQVPQELIYHVSGIKLDVSASVDKTAYQPGETAYLTLDVVNLSDMADLTLTAQAKVGGKQLEQEFNLAHSAQVTLRLPVTSEEKLSYGIYAEGGRALYLNSTYVRVAGKPVNLIPDKTVYKPGDTVRVDVLTDQAGLLSVKAPGFTDQIDIQGSTNFSFNLPPAMKTGTYLIDFELGQAKGEVAFDVAGTDVKIAEFKLDKTNILPGDTIATKMTLESNEAFTGGLVLMLESPSGETTQAARELVNVTPGENTIKASFDVAAGEPGIYELSYILTKDDLTLVAGRASFDVAGPSLISMETNQPSYKPGEDVLVLIDAFSAEPAAGKISVYVDGSLAEEEPVVFQGYQWLPINTGRQTLGNHSLKVILSSGAAAAAKTLDFTVADHGAPTTSILYTGQPGRNDWFTSDVTIALEALDDNLGAGVDRIEYKLDGADWTPHAGPLAFGAEDAHELFYRAVDKAGNVEFAKTKKIKIDKTLPQTQATFTGGAGQSGWYTSDVAVSLTAADSLSGVAAVIYSQDGGVTWNQYSMPFVVTAEGQTDVLFRAEDLAGNVEATQTAVVKIDKTAPEAAVKFDPTTKDITVTGDDNLGGPVAVAFSEIDAHNEDEHGENTKTYSLTDESGNRTDLVMNAHKEGHELKAEIKSISCNGVKAAELPENSLNFEFSFKSAKLDELHQFIQVEHQFQLTAKYEHKKDVTTIHINQGGLESKTSRLGLVLVGLKTHTGQFRQLIDP